MEAVVWERPFLAWERPLPGGSGNRVETASLPPGCDTLSGRPHRPGRHSRGIRDMRCMVPCTWRHPGLAPASRALPVAAGPHGMTQE